jgi:hypothetical protein
VKEDALVAVGDLQRVGDLHRGPALDVPEPDHLPLRLREHLDRGLDHPKRLAREDPIVRPGAWRCGPMLRAWLLRRVEEAVGIDGWLCQFLGRRNAEKGTIRRSHL